VDESALSVPANAAPPAHVFEGHLELLGEKDGGQMQVLRGELGPEYAYLQSSTSGCQIMATSFPFDAA
jgi:hypothetical protein